MMSSRSFTPGFRSVTLLAALLVVLVATGGYLYRQNGPPGDRDSEYVDFNRHIRPILSTNCYVCHGPDISTREAGLRLDLRDSAIVELESGERAVIPGDADHSALIQRVTAANPEDRMPPAEFKKVLTREEVDLLRRWIDQGAEWKKHWSLVPPERNDIPAVRRTRYVDNAIDRFIVARLEREGLKPAPAASKEKLIRRLSFVLTGLPPTPDGLDAFLSDASPGAYERLVDRLLASPHFGERWTRHWMDVVRYADTKGHEFDFPVPGAWQYRDYLIRAFNEDVPYDQLVREHLAGDLLAAPRLNPEHGFDESRLGTAFFALGEGKHSPVDLVVDEAERIDNIIDVSSKAFQGLTVACAKCHDHKFDPIPTTDYYAWYGIIKSTRFAPLAVNVGWETRTAISTIEAHDATMRRVVATRWKEDLQRQTAHFPIEVSTSEEKTGYGCSPVDSSAALVLGDFRGGRFDGWYANGLAFGGAPLSGDLQFDETRRRVGSIGRPRASSAALSRRLMGALRSPDFEIAHDYITVRAAGRKSVARVVIDNFQLIRNPIYGGLEKNIDDPDMHDVQFDLRMWKGRRAYLELLPGWYDRHDFFVDDTSYVEAEYAVRHDGALDEEVTSRCAARDRAIEHDEALRMVHRWEQASSTPEDIRGINALMYRGLLTTSTDSWSGQLEDIASERRASESKIALPDVMMGVVEGEGQDHPVFLRGNVSAPGEQAVPRRALTLYDPEQTPFEAQGDGRLEWAASVTDPANPLTARVMVNRVWHHVFGYGLVESVDNFGIQGALPSHPELLDFLALRFIEDGWSIKSLIRSLVLSQTFRRSLAASEKAQEIDPENRLLQHYPTRRLEAEAIRDAVLAASGQLNTTLYGESVPVHLSPFMKGRGRPEISGPLDGDGRRSIYIAVRRNFLPPMMLVFDMPIPFTTFGRRNTSTVPAQSLTLLNDPFIAEQAVYWARKMVALKELDAAGRIRHMYRSALSREPTDAEVAAGLAFLETQADTYGLAETRWLNDARPWADFGHVIFNMKEFIHLI